MKTSKRSFDLLDLARDLPTTEEDVRMLRECRRLPPMRFETYLRFLASFPDPSPESLHSRNGPGHAPPFELK